MGGTSRNIDRRSAVAALFLLAPALAIPPGCARRQPGDAGGVIPVFDDSPARESVAPDLERGVKVVFASLMSPEESFYKYQRLVDSIADRLGMPVSVVHRQTYEEANNLLRTGEADFGFICSLAYVIGRRDGILTGIAAPVIDGEKRYRCYIIAHSDSGITSLSDLAGKSFAFTDPLSYTGRVAALYAIKEATGRDDSEFSEILYTYSHDSSIRAVHRELVDAAAVDSIVFNEFASLNADLVSNILPIYEGPLAGMPPVVASSKTDPALVEAFSAILLGMTRDAEGRAILEDLGYDAFEALQESDYQVILDAVDTVGISTVFAFES